MDAEIPMPEYGDAAVQAEQESLELMLHGLEESSSCRGVVVNVVVFKLLCNSFVNCM